MFMKNGEKVFLGLSNDGYLFDEDWSKIFQQVVMEYDMLRRKRPYMALAQYAEEARHQGKPVMFLESLGYMIYMGQLAHAAPLSNMQFYADQSRSYVTNPLWQQYKINVRDTSNEPVFPGGNSIIIAGSCRNQAMSKPGY